MYEDFLQGDRDFRTILGRDSLNGRIYTRKSQKTINFNNVKRVTTTPKRSPSGMFSAISLVKHGITINAIRSVANVGNRTLKDTSVK